MSEYVEFRIPGIVNRTPVVTRRAIRLDQLLQWWEHTEVVMFGDKKLILRGSMLSTVAGEINVLETYDEVQKMINGQGTWPTCDEMVDRYNKMIDPFEEIKNLEWR